MPWNGTKVWTVGEKARSTDFNDYLSDNLDYLFNGRPQAIINVNQSADFTTGVATFVDVSTTVFGATLNINSTKVRVAVRANGQAWADATVCVLKFDITVDGVRQAGDDGLFAITGGGTENTTNIKSICFEHIITGLSAGNHTFRLQWAAQDIAGGTRNGKLYAGAGTSDLDLHPQFIVEEWQ